MDSTNRTRDPHYALLLAVVLLLLVSTWRAEAGKAYEGYKFVKNPGGYDKAQCVIEHANPTAADAVLTWAGLDNNDSSNWMWLQGGWIKETGWTNTKMYYEYKDENGTWSGIQYMSAPTGAAGMYGARKNGSYAECIYGGTAIRLPWSNFDRVPFCGAQFGAELDNSPNDYTPGSVGNPCDFSSAMIREAGGADVSAPFANASLRDSASNGEVSTSASGSFWIWDNRVP